MAPLNTPLVGVSFWWRDALPHTTQLGLGKRRWNLETSSTVVEFPPPYPYLFTSVVDCHAYVVLRPTISPPRRETPGSIPTSTKKIHDIYGAILG